MNNYFWISILTLFIFLILKIVTSKNFKNNKKKFLFYLSELIGVIVVLIATFLSVFIALHFNQIEKEKEAEINFNRYINISLDELEINKLRLKKQVELFNANWPIYLSQFENGENYVLVCYPHAFVNLYNNEFLNGLSNNTIINLSDKISFMNRQYSILNSFNMNYMYLTDMYASYHDAILDVQIILLNELYYRNGIIENEVDLSIKNTGDFYYYLLDEDEEINTYKRICLRIKQNKDIIDKYMPENGIDFSRMSQDNKNIVGR